METVDIVALLATVLTIGLFSSGIETCRKIHVSKSVGSSPHLPFIACSLNCALWLLYGCLKPDTTVILVNAVGLILQLVYIIVYHTYTDNKFAVKRDTAIASAVVFTSLLYFTKLAGDSDTSLFYLGLLCNVFTILFFASPLSTLAEVIRKQSTESLSFLMSLMSVLSCVTWTVYGFMVGDNFIVVPNAIGLLLSLTQLSLFVIYKNGKKIVSLNNSVI